jgi:CRP/FNR family transcriptional regulator, cyclic AMP receptor protein
MPMEQLPALQLLKKIYILQDLQEKELQQVLDIAEERDFPQGATIMREGEPGEMMYIIRAGEVEITKRLILEIDEDAPRDKVMIRLRADQGVIFGEMALIENDVRSATVSALTPCRLLEVKKDAFFKLINQNPATGVKILLRLGQLLSNRLRKSSEDVVKLTTALAIALDR